MKYLREFKEENVFYIKITHAEWSNNMNDNDRPRIFTTKEKRDINQYLNDYNKVYSKINKIDYKYVLTYIGDDKIERLSINTKETECCIDKSKDEWYLACCLRKSGYAEQFNKCDQFDGLIEFIKNEIIDY